MATHSSILAWKIPGTEEPGGLQSRGSQRVGHDQATKHTYTNKTETNKHTHTHTNTHTHTKTNSMGCCRNKQPKILWDAAEVVLRKNYIAIHACLGNKKHL